MLKNITGSREISRNAQTGEIQQDQYYSTPDIYSSNGASQFRVPLTSRLTELSAKQVEQNDHQSAPGSHPLTGSPQFRTPTKLFPDMPATPLPGKPTLPIGAAQFRGPTTPFPNVPATPLPGKPTPPIGAAQFRGPTTPFPNMPVTSALTIPATPSDGVSTAPKINPLSLESKRMAMKPSRQSVLSPQVQLPSWKAGVSITAHPTHVHTAFPQTLPSTPFPAHSEPQVQSLSLAHEHILHPAIGDCALYSQKHSTIAGQAQEMQSLDGRRLAFTSIFSQRAKILLWAYLVFCTWFNVAFILWIIEPDHIILSSNPFIEALLITGLIALVTIEFIRIIQGISLLFFALHAKDPIPLSPARNLRVAILTTIVPSKEPIEVLEKTLRAMKAITYAGTVDVWVLDEGNDPAVMRLAQNLGVFHFSRKGNPQFNQPSGEFKAKTKAGNHNSWRALYEKGYDVVAQMDPDHTPFPNFLERTLGYFRDPDVAFVVAPQVYGNLETNRLTKAAAAQAFIFHGLIQRGGNGLGAPLLIGTNHLYRPRAWKQIQGYQDSIIEDHLTSITIQGAKNPATGNQWRGVYTPDILSVGEGPSSWTDYFNQQKRWAYGVWEIILRHDWKLLRKLSPAQGLAYISLQLFYPSVAVTWILGAMLMFLNLVLGVSSIGANSVIWASLWTISILNQIGLYFWLSRLNLVKHERVRYGFHAMLLTLFTAPIYASAALQALRHKKLEYRVTAKGNLQTIDRLETFSSHLKWFGLTSLFIALGLIENRIASASFAWAVFTDAIVIAPVLLFLARRNRPSHAKTPVTAYDTKSLVWSRTANNWSQRASTSYLSLRR